MKKTPVSFQLSPIAKAVALATATASLGANAQETSTDDDELAIEEIIVTATKREMSMQDVPLAIEAFDSEQIEKLGLNNMADYMRSIASISTVTTSPGRNEVVFRGVSTGSGEWRTDSGSAVYFGDIPMTSATQAVDPRTVDVARIEALPGPQGTLFGSSSQSGALRIIPNRPDHSGGYGEADLGYTYNPEGDPSRKIELWANVPLVDGKLAARVAAFDVESGGYVDNVLGENVFTSDTNDSVVEDDFNVWNQSGFRLSALWTVSDNWDIELMAMRQEQTSRGDWMSDPNRDGLDDYEIVRFHKDLRNDDWWLGALTLTGDVGFAEFKSVTSVLDRKVFYEFDANPDGQIRAQRVLTPGEYIYYNVLYDTGFQPEVSVNDQTAERFTQEFRLTSYGDSRLQWMIGAFYEETDDKWDYAFARVENLSETPFGYFWGLGYYIDDTDVWYKEDFSSTTKQTAVFGEFSYDITDSLTATLGARWFEYDRDRSEAKSWPEGNIYDTDTYVGKDDDTLYKFGLSYSFDDDKMIYAVYSEGFRLGGFNSIKNPASVLPDRYDPDRLTNQEIGIKSTWLDGSLRLNAAIYRMEWEDIQRGITDPDDWTANGTVNFGNADIDGFEVTLAYQPVDGLRIDASYASNDSELQNDYFLRDIVPLNDPANQDEQLGAAGQNLAIQPPSKWWVGVEYTAEGLFGGLDGWVRYDHSWEESKFHDWWNALNEQTGDGGTKLIGDQSHGNLQFSVGDFGSWDLTLSIWNVWDDRNAYWVASDYDGWLGQNGTFNNTVGAGKYVNMPYYSRPREFELTFRKQFEF